MAWSLEIHHIDVRKAGDATLIVARNPNNPVGEQLRSVLIDGGLAGVADHVHTYITTTAGLASVNALVATHYDADHLGGLVTLLKKNVTTYDTARVYDRGWPALGPSNLYLSYLNAINSRTGRNRVTRAVRAADQAPGILLSMVNKKGSAAIPAGDTPVQVAQAINQPAKWLISGPQAEILQATGANAPTLTCVACNQWVQRPNGTPVLAAQGVSEAENACSLAFLLRFGEFTYYIGGDIEDPQESVIAALANPNDNAAGRVLVVKASHHGANTATSAQFVQRMRPLAVMVSNSTGNQHGHPAQETVNVLNGYPRGVGYTLPVPPASPGRPRRTYFTGFDSADNTDNVFVSLGIVAGDPSTGNHPGHVRVDVSEAQAFGNRNFPGRAYRAVLAVADIAAKATGISLTLVQAQTAAEAAVKGTLVDVVQTLVNTPEASNTASALWVLRSKRAGGVKSEYLQQMTAMPPDLNDWLDGVELQKRILGRAGTLTDIYQCVDTAEQFSATASAALPGTLAGLTALPGCIDGLAAAYQVINNLVPFPAYTGAVQSGLDQAKQARDILANGAGRVAVLAGQATTAAQQVHSASSVQQAMSLAETAINSADNVCVAVSDTLSNLADCYKLAARAGTNPSPALVAVAITRACGKTAAGAVTGAIAGAVSGNGGLQSTEQALHFALQEAGVDSSQAVAALREALTGDDPLFTVSYYKATAHQVVQDNLS
ncbi:MULTISPECIES: ComEC/Rec2 family competence protein [unclassified Pseudomonas]|uniref:ComEC/Rec2 family competence protein n=1 Tax=unclassified Pseudomonas TaxID=196821 RepID=UPI0021CACACB|nr:MULTISPECIES: hypothetical protein [unclassified Pseudomonas]MCU1733360.1 hypothetical protein [Pseudomonas sp. 20P_3.2_Bac4]MCU1743923.1 hypothetical protein [Pseudomonas sp. 20P_3.2_Bac5]